MDLSHFFTVAPIGIIFVVTVVIAFTAFEGGFQIGRHRFQHPGKNKDVPIGSMVGSTFGLLAFILAFTFGMAANHFDARKQAVLSDANAIRSTYGMSGLLPKSQQEKVKKLLREYVDLRLEAVQSPDKLGPRLARSEEIHDLLLAEAMACENGGSATGSSWLFTQSLDNMINGQYSRLAVSRSVRIPGTIWLALYSILAFSMLGAGYNCGSTGGRGAFIFTILCVAFSLVLILIADLDRPQQGLFKVSQQSLVDLQKRMKADKF